MEAAACSRPLVATDVPGCREIVVPEETGLLVPPRDPAALADALARMVADTELRRRCGHGARVRVEHGSMPERSAARRLLSIVNS